MAKKQTRRSISVSRTTYERLKAFCESNNISMSQLVETRVNDFLGPGEIPPSGLAPTMPNATVAVHRPIAPRPMMPSGMAMAPRAPEARPAAPAAAGGPGAATASAHPSHHPSQASQAAPMTSAAARFAVEPPPPIIKPRQDTAAPKPAEKRPEQIFTF